MGSNKRKRKREAIVKMTSPKIGSNAASKATSGDLHVDRCACKGTLGPSATT